MKSRICQLVVLAFAGTALLSGCVTAKKSSVNSVAIAVTTSDGKAPSQQQVARILEVVGPELMRAGFQLSRTAVEADFVVTVKFTADVEGKGGQISVAGIEPNKRFRAAGGSEVEETREARRRIREMDAWAAREMTRTDP